MRTRMQKLRVALLAALTVGSAVLFSVAGPAHADVDSVAGSAFGASITSTLLGTVLAPSPAGIAGSAAEPADGFGPVSAASCPLPVPATSVCVQVPGLLSLGAINAATQGAGVAGDNHLGFATSSASVADIAVGTVGSGLFAQAVSSTCTADGNGARGSTQVVGGNLGGSPLVQSPAAGTTLSVPGILNVILNEQLPIPPASSINSVGSAGIIVNGAHITLLPAVGGLTGTLDIILAQSVCAAAGPDVNVVQATTTTTAGPGATTTTTRVGATTTTVGTGATTTTVAPVVTPSTTPGTGINVCNAGNGGNGGTGTGIGGSASAGGGNAAGGGATGGTATGGNGTGTGGAAGSGGNACNGTGIIPISLPTVPTAGIININICNAGNGGNGGNGTGIGGPANAGGGTGGTSGSATGGSATGGAGTGTGGAGGNGGDACNVTLAAATTTTTAAVVVPVVTIIGGGTGGFLVANGTPVVPGIAGVANVGLLARTGAHLGPVALMAMVLTVLGMLLFFGSQGLPDPAARRFVSHPMFRPAHAGGARVLPAGASSRLDGAALDALIEMTGSPAEPDATPPQGRRGGPRRGLFSQRPW